MELSGASCRLPGVATAERHLRAVVVKKCAGNFWGVFQPASDNANYHLISISHKNICCPGHLRVYREAETILCFSACGLLFKGFTDLFTLSLVWDEVQQKWWTKSNVRTVKSLISYTLTKSSDLSVWLHLLLVKPVWGFIYTVSGHGTKLAIAKCCTLRYLTKLGENTGGWNVRLYSSLRKGCKRIWVVLNPRTFPDQLKMLSNGAWYDGQVNMLMLICGWRAAYLDSFSLAVQSDIQFTHSLISASGSVQACGRLHFRIIRCRS